MTRRASSVRPYGQVNYVAANAWLDAWAQEASGAGRGATSVQWGAWGRARPQLLKMSFNTLSQPSFVELDATRLIF